jgi:nitrite reductase/ring-hydroxylating ferredoxin subunit
MAKFILAAKASEFEDGTKKEVSVNGNDILLVRVGDQFYACQAKCPHWGWPLVRGRLTGTVLECSFHWSRFDLKDGRIIRWTIGHDRPAKAFPYGFLTLAKQWKPRKLKVHKIKLEGENILVEV